MTSTRNCKRGTPPPNQQRERGGSSVYWVYYTRRRARGNVCSELICWAIRGLPNPNCQSGRALILEKKRSRDGFFFKVKYARLFSKEKSDSRKELR